MIELIATGIMLGLATNLHCIGMCGPIAFILPLDRSSQGKKFFGLSLYNVGRISSYVLLGGFFGLFGQGLHLGRFQQYTAIGFGVLMLMWIYFPMITKGRLFRGSLLIRLNNYIKNKLGSRLRNSSPGSLFTIGVLNGLLPCGMVYLAIAGSVAVGNFSEGVIFMLAFGIGTLPVMVFIPLLSHKLNISRKFKTSKLIPVVMTAFALVIILRGMNLDIPYISPKLNEDGTEVLSCCHDNTECYEDQ